MLVDEVKITVQAGDGGNGCMSFRREKFIPRGGPNGGDGGHGGDIVFKADPNVQTLVDFIYRPLFRGRHGVHGKGKNQYGRDVEPMVVLVPVGTRVFLENGELMADLSRIGQEIVVAKGGRGGRGNASFATSTRQAPHMAEKGEPGEKRVLKLELSLIADVGIVGFPNAGKSTLLSRVTHAKPKIADYPFTTLEPQLGVVKMHGGRSFVMADVPGLIEGAHTGKGLGIQFLRHLERTRILLHLVELPEAKTLADIDKRIKVIRKELESHHPKFLKVPQVLVLTKTDAFTDKTKLHTWTEKLRKKWGKIALISAVTGEGIPELLETVWAGLQSVSTVPPLEVVTAEETEPTVYEGKKRFKIHEAEGAFYVEGAEIRKWVAMTDFENRDAVERFHRILSRMGVIRELKKLGLLDGRTVYCEGEEMTYREERERKRRGGRS